MLPLEGVHLQGECHHLQGQPQTRYIKTTLKNWKLIQVSAEILEKPLTDLNRFFLNLEPKKTRQIFLDFDNTWKNHSVNLNFVLGGFKYTNSHLKYYLI